jgi:hypothetical protein
MEEKKRKWEGKGGKEEGRNESKRRSTVNRGDCSSPAVA